jgi:hypothetical protein
MSDASSAPSRKGRDLIQRSRDLARTLVRRYEPNESFDSRQRQIERFYTSQCSLIHPFFKLNGSRRVANLFALWALLNWFLKPEIREIYLNPSEDEVFIDFVHHFQLIPWLMPWPRGFRMGVRLVWIQDAIGNHRVSHHEDLYRLDMVLDLATFGLYSHILVPIWSLITDIILDIFGYIVGVKFDN